jgi:hypothetical protein
MELMEDDFHRIPAGRRPQGFQLEIVWKECIDIVMACVLHGAGE